MQIALPRDRWAAVGPVASFTIAAIGVATVAVFVFSWFAAGNVPGDAVTYAAAGQRLNAGHEIYRLLPGDNLVLMEPPYPPYPLLSPPLVAVIFRPLAVLPGLAGAWVWWAAMAVVLAAGQHDALQARVAGQVGELEGGQPGPDRGEGADGARRGGPEDPAVAADPDPGAVQAGVVGPPGERDRLGVGVDASPDVGGVAVLAERPLGPRPVVGRVEGEGRGRPGGVGDRPAEQRQGPVGRVAGNLVPHQRPAQVDGVGRPRVDGEDDVVPAGGPGAGY